MRLAVALGLWLQQLWCLGSLFIVAALRRRLRGYLAPATACSRFLDWRQQLQTVHGQGLWAALETLIYRRQTENRAAQPAPGGHAARLPPGRDRAARWRPGGRPPRRQR